MSIDYNKTLNLPNTDFSMRASLPLKEPEMVARLHTQKIYEKMVEKNKDKPTYILHDGPPYANGDIHLGTALNKVLKDIIVKNKNMAGFYAPYIPGWDTHGLPIELKALKKVGVKADIEPVELRKHCKDFALFYMENQKEQFKRLGVLADYDHPYLTLLPEFEARQIEVFGKMVEKDYIYKGLKPVYWCPECNTALAEAEIEYEEDPCESVYVSFSVKKDNGVLEKLGIDATETNFIIWTTTTWTLPANMAICLGRDFEYDFVKTQDAIYIIAKELVQATMKVASILNYEVIATCLGKELEKIVCSHPFLERDSLVILGDHVTLESGTGCVHTAPGHGVDDFLVCTNEYPAIEVIVPVDNLGVLTQQAGQFAGLKTQKANTEIVKHLKEIGNLFAMEHIKHQYPHCWRCKNPIIFRATEQWFCSIDGFKEDAIAAIKQVTWIPGWGEDRIIGMVRDRSDWCISRQRIWGVPIPIFYCIDCGKYHVDSASIKAVSDLFRVEGSDAWYKKTADEILPKDTKCTACGGTTFTKETDIMDVWFDSGVSHSAVLEQRAGLSSPCDLYLEGNDQYRGWFQSSLLTSVAWSGKAPYKTVCTHGWVVDGQGRKQSKSMGNGVIPEDIIKEYGADILRLWVASSDYHTDIRISKDILKQLSEVYRKIRNTARYILGNIDGFDPMVDSVPYDELLEIDKWALLQLDHLIEKSKQAYDSLDFHVIYHGIYNFCTVHMSNFYLDIIKDRLYVDGTKSLQRRAAQTTIYKILRELSLLLAPILSFTANEIWEFMPEDVNYNKEHILLNNMANESNLLKNEAFEEKWKTIQMIRDDVNKALENARVSKIIGKSLEAKVILVCNETLFEFANNMKKDFAAIFIVSEVEILKGDTGTEKGMLEGLYINIEKAQGEKCERCWIYSGNIGENPAHPTICLRCATVIEQN
ncbi:MAG: isoleucine--tRNA ligase [Oscillospiraceae bacterium]